MFRRDFQSDFTARLYDGQLHIGETGLQTFNQGQCRLGHGSARNGGGSEDLPLQLKNAVDKGLGGRRTDGAVDIDWPDEQANAHPRIRRGEVTATTGENDRGVWRGRV